MKRKLTKTEKTLIRVEAKNYALEVAVSVLLTLVLASMTFGLFTWTQAIDNDRDTKTVFCDDDYSELRCTGWEGFYEKSTTPYADFCYILVWILTVVMGITTIVSFFATGVIAFGEQE